MLIDTHFHTNVYENYEGALIKALNIMQESKILAVSNTVDIPSYRATLRISKKSPFILPAFGIHPQMAPDYIENLNTIQKYLDDALIYGEIGLDHVHITDKTQYPLQEKMLEFFFKNAKTQKKIVILHLDGAEEKGLDMIQEFSLKKVVVHGYCGSIETAKQMIDSGIYFSIGGNMINDKFKSLIPDEDWSRIQQIVKLVPNDLLLIETDGPCRTDPDASANSPRSMPDYVIETMKRVARLRGIKNEELEDITTKNFLKSIEDDYRLESYNSLIYSLFNSL